MEKTTREELTQLLRALLNSLNDSQEQPQQPHHPQQQHHPQQPQKPPFSNTNNKQYSSGPPKKKNTPSPAGVGSRPQNLSVRPGPPYLSPTPLVPTSVGGGGGTFTAIVDSLVQQAAGGVPGGISTADIVLGGGGLPAQQKKRPAAGHRPPKKAAAQSVFRPGGTSSR
jgi:hypothetical protein